MTAETPLAAHRKIARGELAPGCPVHADADGVWHVQDVAAARAMLRSTETRQAGFNAENAAKLEGRMRLPVLYRDGPEHRENRRQTAKYFTPRRVDTAYRSLMERLADEQCAVLRRRGEADLSQLSFALAVAVAAEVIGLTESGSMAARLNRFFEGTAAPNRLAEVLKEVRSNANMALFYWRDVRPAIAVRRRERRDDLISHLLDEGCTKSEILGECVMFAAAGMVTTREFITAAAWHLLTDDELRAAFTGGDEKQRAAILHELLRLEPVVGNILRRTTADVAVPGAVIPAGARVDVGVAAANLDPGAIGPDAGRICPGRAMPDGVGDAGMSFGDGPHRCPGAYIAIQETDIFLSKLLAMPGLRMVSPPKVGLRPEIASYELTNLRLSVR
ncbi:cytochrome P450 [Actinoplanes sp. NPDC049681]|uniref:cytochrome P450 n=1 Tax=Actinoplanes sp. NPDC049681 TaxID=3363905 RepID=UPI00379F1C00